MKMKTIKLRDQAVLSNCRREISLHVRTPISKKVYRRSRECRDHYNAHKE